LTQRVQSSLLSSGNRAGTRQLLPDVLQRTHRSPLGNRLTRHLAVAILVAIAPHPVFLANKVFGVRAAAVVKLKIVLVDPDFGQSAKLEVQQRL